MGILCEQNGYPDGRMEPKPSSGGTFSKTLQKTVLVPYSLGMIYSGVIFKQWLAIKRYAWAWAWTAVMATTPTMSSAEHPLERSLTGFAIPWVTGPYASAFASL